MSKKITLNNISNFIEANKNLLLTELGQKPQYFLEQISYRMMLCKDDCNITKECIICGCTFPDRLYATQSCNKERFPDLMNEEDWNKYKEENEIK